MKIFNEKVQQAYSERYKSVNFWERIHNVPAGDGSAQMKEFIRKLAGEEDENAWQQTVVIFTMHILEMIYEKTLEKQVGCTMQEIRDFFEEEVLGVLFPETSETLTPEEIDYMVTYIVRDKLQNGGRPFLHKIYDYKEKRFAYECTKVIEDTKEEGPSGTAYYYKVTPETIGFMLRSYEIDQAFDFDANISRLLESFKRQNTREVEETCERYLRELILKQQEIEKLRERIVRDLISVESAEFNEQLENCRRVEKTVTEGYEKIYKAWEIFDSEQIHEATGKDIRKVKSSQARIKVLISRICDATQDLRTAKSGLQNARRTVFENRNSAAARKNMMDFRGEILSRVPEMRKISDIMDIFLPLGDLCRVKLPAADVLYQPQRNADAGSFEKTKFVGKLTNLTKETKDDETLEELMAYIASVCRPGDSISLKEMTEGLKASGRSDLTDDLALYFQTLRLFMTAHNAPDHGIFVSAGHGEPGDRCLFEAKADGKRIDMENLRLIISEAKEEKGGY